MTEELQLRGWTAATTLQSLHPAPHCISHAVVVLAAIDFLICIFFLAADDGDALLVQPLGTFWFLSGFLEPFQNVGQKKTKQGPES